MKGLLIFLLALASAKQLVAKALVADNHQTYPGTKTRPILSDDEAKKYIENNYFSGWVPEEIVIPDQPDYIVTSRDSIQEVVNRAIREGSPSFRTYIRIDPGMYMETIYIQGNIPLTIYGAGETADDVHIMATLSANTTTADYKSYVNPNGQRYQEGDPAWSLYNSCANKADIIGTSCSAIFWVKSDNFQLHKVKVHNDATGAQAVSIKTSGDKIHLMNNHFLGIQDTVGLGIDENENKKVERVFVHMGLIEGDVDYVFGGAAAVFYMVTFNTRAVNPNGDLIVFAPNTSPDRTYGFLVVNSTITGNSSYPNQVKLARSWDSGIHKVEDYVPGTSPNGQLVIRESIIDNSINVNEPYGSAATSERPFSTDISTDRDLDNNQYNRLWEYNNKGDGA